MLWLALSVLVSVPHALPVRKGTLHLQNAVDLSTLVCIGTVTQVDTLKLPEGWNAPKTADANAFDMGPTEARVGRIVVERVLKGDPATKVAYHEAWPTWICDSTSAEEGQRSLFFLRPGQVAAAGPELHDSASTALGGAPILRNVGSGDGIVQISLCGGEECVQFFGAPKSLEMKDAKYHQRLAAMVKDIEVLARFAPELSLLHATSRPGRGAHSKGFDVRILADGGMRLSTNGGEYVRVSAIGESNWRVLQASLAALIGPDPISIGDPGTYNPYRSLRVALSGAQLSFVDDDSVIVSGMEDAELVRYQRVIRAWQLVRETMDCVDCIDHRARDADLLGR